LCGLGDRATLCHPLGNLWSWLVYHTEFSSSCWQASGVGGHNCVCHVDGPLNLMRDLLCIAPCLGVPQIAGCKVVGVLTRTLGGLESSPWFHEWRPSKLGERGNLSSQSLWCDAMTFCRCSSTILMYYCL
jgi:hypothetical protein